MAHKAIGPGSLVASRFRLEDLLEEHSGARFWRATDLTLARNVAIHVIGRDDPRAAAVLTAARTSATVSDQRILRVLDAVEEDDLVHVVHEWGAGTSLDQLLTEELLEPRRAAWLVREVAEAIAVGHRQGIAHGRLVPESVLLTDVGSVKLVGFVVDAVLHGRKQPTSPVLGPDGTAPSEHESDVLNLGALLYACLTGKWAGFPASVLPEAPHDHGRVCRPRQVRAGVPKQLDALCDQILNASPGGRRYETASEVCAALGEYLGDTHAHAAVNVSEPTAFVDPAALRSPQAQAAATLGSYDAVPTAERPRADALHDTQPGLPLPDSGSWRAPEPNATVRTAPVPRPAEPAARSGATTPPAHWGPDRPERSAQRPERPERPKRSERRPGSTWWRLAAVVGVLALLLLAFLLWPQLTGDDAADDPGSSSSQSPEAGEAPQDVEIASVDDFDPDGGAVPEENADLVPLATDGKPGTAWETKTYFDGPVLAPYRSGVGLLVDLGEVTEVSEVAVTLVGGPYGVELLAAAEGVEEPPTGTEGLITLEARGSASGEVTLRGEESVRTRYVVVFLTALPRSTDGYQGGIAEVVVRS